ncbi:response regulator transcription factor [uncultured Sphingomonas sp.]|uniref:response regulator transcription factor n=1 Tax=uncultured Sphingomonas sp. TaxID=158754 RepID=UPI0025D9D9E1|nr:response regulator transcription factor [uncultured Sphingomonas sp.]
MKLLIVEDDVEYAVALKAELAQRRHDVTIADTGPSALTAVEREGFDAMILDSMLPQLTGVAVVERLRAAGHSLPVLMLSALGRSAEKIGGLTAGADDYCVKPTPAAEIEARLNALLRARGWTAGEADMLRAGDIVVSPGQHRAWRAEQPLDLTRLEFGLLAELVRHAGSFLTRAMLIERVWGYDFEPGTNIVDAQVRLLRRKLTAGGDEDPIVTKRGVGYMLRA